MRLRKVKNAKETLEKSPYYIKDKDKYRGHYEELFQNKNPIHLEIGMGKGTFLIEMAKTYPNINFIGVEKEITAYFFYIYDRKHFVSGCRCMRLFIQLSRIVAIFPEIHGNHRFYTVVVPAVNGVISVLSEIQVFAL